MASIQVQIIAHVKSILSQRVDVEEGGQLLDIARTLNFMPGFNIEGFPNRNSEMYRDIYGIKDAHSVLRGTIRYQVSEGELGSQSAGYNHFCLSYVPIIF